MATDRFRYRWSGPKHPSALRWTVTHGVSFMIPGGITDETGSGIYQLWTGPPGAPVADIRAENKKYNEELRAHHAVDTDLDTGTSEKLEDMKLKWYEASRGEKLRDCKFFMETYTAGLTIACERIRIDGSCPGKDTYEYAWRCSDLVGKHLVFLSEIRDIHEKLREMVLQECWGWDWKKGMVEQEVERNELEFLIQDRIEFIRDNVVDERLWLDVLGIDLAASGKAVRGADGRICIADIDSSSQNWPKGFGLL